MSLNYLTEFDRLYAIVFDESEEVRPDTKQPCKELITLCEKISQCGAGKYGNIQTGDMNTEAVKALYTQLIHIKRD